MSFVDKVLVIANNEVENSRLTDAHTLQVGDRTISVEDADNDSVFRVVVSKGWELPKVFRDVFATDLFETIMKGVNYER